MSLEKWVCSSWRQSGWANTLLRCQIKHLPHCQIRDSFAHSIIHPSWNLDCATTISRKPYHTINSGKRLNCLKAGWEPWSSGYWRRLMFWRLWVQIAVLDTGKTFSHLFKINDVLFDWKDWNKWKETRVGPFKNCLKASLPILLSSA